MFRLLFISLLLLVAKGGLLAQEEPAIKQPDKNYHRIGIYILPHTAWQYTDILSSPFGNTQMYSAGFSYERKIIGRIGFEADFQYSYYLGHGICDSILYSDFGRTKCLITEREKLHFLGIPLILTATLIKKPRMHFNIMAGIQPGILVKRWSKIDGMFNNYPTIYVGHLMTGFETQYKLSEKFSLSGQLRIEMAYVAVTIGLAVGVSYTL